MLELLVCTLQNFTIRALYEFVASGGKLQSSLAKNLVSFLGWVKVGSLQDIAVNDEGGKTLQKRDLQY